MRAWGDAQPALIVLGLFVGCGRRCTVKGYWRFLCMPLGQRASCGWSVGVHGQVLSAIVFQLSEIIAPELLVNRMSLKASPLLQSKYDLKSLRYSSTSTLHKASADHSARTTFAARPPEARGVVVFCSLRRRLSP